MKRSKSKWSLFAILMTISGLIALYFISGKNYTGLDAIRGAYEDLRKYRELRREELIARREADEIEDNEYYSKLTKLNAQIQRLIESQELSDQELAEKLSFI